MYNVKKHDSHAKIRFNLAIQYLTAGVSTFTGMSIGGIYFLTYNICIMLILKTESSNYTKELTN